MLEALSGLGQTVRATALQGISADDEAQFLAVLLRIRENLAAAGHDCDTPCSTADHEDIDP
jgi:hypothetical protein